MSTKLYVGNLSFDVTEDDLCNMLSPHGPVNEINVIMDRETGRARGFAFVTMNTQEAATAAITALNGNATAAAAAVTVAEAGLDINRFNQLINLRRLWLTAPLASNNYGK